VRLYIIAGWTGFCWLWRLYKEIRLNDSLPQDAEWRFASLAGGTTASTLLHQPVTWASQAQTT
jgi:hypothetical protein